MLESVTVIAGLNNVAMMGQSIQQGRCQLGITKDFGPFGEPQISGYDGTVNLTPNHTNKTSFLLQAATLAQ